MIKKEREVEEKKKGYKKKNKILEGHWAWKHI